MKFVKGKINMHWLTWSGLFIILIGTALTILGQQIINNKSNEKITALSQKNIELSTELNTIYQEIVANVTGGKSICYLFPTPSFHELNTIDFYLNHKGEYPIYDVSIKIWNATSLNQIDHAQIHQKYFGYKTKEVTLEEWENMKSDPEYIIKSTEMQNEIQNLMKNCLLVNEHLGTVSPNLSVNIMDTPLIKCSIPPGTDFNSYEQEYDISIIARNGVYKQKIKIDIRKKRYHVYSIVEKIITSKKREVVREYESQDTEGFVIKLLK